MGRGSVYILFVCFFTVFLLLSNDCLFAQVSPYEFSPFGAHPADPYFEAKNLGVKWNRGVYFSWGMIDPGMTGDSNRFQWKLQLPDRFVDFDRMMHEESQAGLLGFHNIIVDGEYGRSRYRKPGSWLPANIEAYRNFVKTLVRRYPFVRVWQVENEPDLKDIPDPVSFAGLQRITYEAVKEANPNAKVFIAGLAKHPGVGGITEPSFYEKVLPLLQGRYIDGYDIHFYCVSKGASSTGDEIYYTDLKKVYNFYRTLFNKYGYYNILFWIAEGGTLSGTGNMGPFSLTQSETVQAQLLVKMWVYSLHIGIEKLFWAYGLVEGFDAWDNDFFDHTGMIYGGQDMIHRPGERKLAYYTLKLLTERLEGSNWKNIETLVSSNGIYIFKFTRGWKSVWVAWNDNGAERQVVVPGIMSPKVKVTEMVPKYNSGQEVPIGGGIFKVTTQTVKNGIAAVLLKNNPVVIEETL